MQTPRQTHFQDDNRPWINITRGLHRLEPTPDQRLFLLAIDSLKDITEFTGP